MFDSYPVIRIVEGRWAGRVSSILTFETLSKFFVVKFGMGKGWKRGLCTINAK